MTEVLGYATDPGIEIEIALRKHALPFEFGKEVVMQAQRLPAEVRPADRKNREDLTALPLVSIDGNPPNIEGNPMIVVKREGQWYGAGFDWFGEGRTCKHMPRYEYGRNQIRVWPLDGSWDGPASGEEVGVLVSTPSSDRIPVRSVNERSNIVLGRFP